MTWWPTPDWVQYWSGLFTIGGVIIAILALLFAIKQLSLSQRAGSVTALAALHDALRQCWADYLNSEPKGKPLAFGDLCNTLEIACAALTDRMFFGESKRVLEGYLLNTLKLIEREELVRDEFLALLHEPDTFSNIHRFLVKHRKQFRSLGMEGPTA
jgi:hypothetical protein